MGTPLAPKYAQTIFGTHEIFFLKNFILRLLLYCCYIKNVIGIWVPPNDPNKEETEWRAFKMLLNMWFRMEWTFELANTSADFIDLAIIIKDSKITTKLYEKFLSLYF
eukprot:14143113-Ditylum_brightwellii.AAC.1